MTQNRLNIPGILHCHKEGTDNLDLAAVANIFVSKYDTWNRSLQRFPQIILLNCALINT